VFDWSLVEFLHSLGGRKTSKWIRKSNQ